MKLIIRRSLLFVILLFSLFSCADSDRLDKKFIFIGDSIIARWPLDETFPSQLVFNFGKSGAGISYLEQYQHRFDGDDVIVMIGTNDTRYFSSDDMDLYVEEYLKLVTALTDKNIYLYSVLPREFEYDLPDINSKIEKFNSSIVESLINYPNIIYLDVYNDFMCGNHINYQYYSDGLHLNIYGYEVLSAHLLDKQ